MAKSFHQMTLDQLWEVVRAIPSGSVMSYGDVGRALSNPASGFMVGRWMASAPEGVPWWRVVAKSGSLPIGKRGPGLASEQEERLRAEGVRFDAQGRVAMGRPPKP
jgi:methylated-DNA-protein-cysteine methyltransferase-like protein